MPTYDYKCTQCGHDFEMFQSMSESHIKKCPECGGNVRRLVGGGSGHIFKGSGFYVTDYVKGKEQKKDEQDSEEFSPLDFHSHLDFFKNFVVKVFLSIALR